jgi:hypothetical protein
MVSQVTWSSMLAGFDAYDLVRKKVLCSHDFVIVFVAGDWVSLYETFLTLLFFIILFL